MTDFEPGSRSAEKWIRVVRSFGRILSREVVRLKNGLNGFRVVRSFGRILSREVVRLIFELGLVRSFARFLLQSLRRLRHGIPILQAGVEYCLIPISGKYRISSRPLFLIRRR